MKSNIARHDGMKRVSQMQYKEATIPSNNPTMNTKQQKSNLNGTDSHTSSHPHNHQGQPSEPQTDDSSPSAAPATQTTHPKTPPQ